MFVCLQGAGLLVCTYIYIYIYLVLKRLSRTCLHKCNRIFLHASQRSCSLGIEGYGSYSTAIKRYPCSYHTMYSILEHVLLLGRGILPADFLRISVFICYKLCECWLSLTGRCHWRLVEQWPKFVGWVVCGGGPSMPKGPTCLFGPSVLSAGDTIRCRL